MDASAIPVERRGHARSVFLDLERPHNSPDPEGPAIMRFFSLSLRCQRSNSEELIMPMGWSSQPKRAKRLLDAGQYARTNTQ